MNTQHIITKPSECDCSKETERCPVCDWGLAVCRICGKAESELDGKCITPNEITGLYRQLSEIETVINQLSPPNFKGQGEPVTLIEKVQWLIDRYNRADRYAKASPANRIIADR